MRNRFMNSRWTHVWKDWWHSFDCTNFIFETTKGCSGTMSYTFLVAYMCCLYTLVTSSFSATLSSVSEYNNPYPIASITPHSIFYVHVCTKHHYIMITQWWATLLQCISISLYAPVQYSYTYLSPVLDWFVATQICNKYTESTDSISRCSSKSNITI